MYLNEIGSTVIPIDKLDSAKQKAKEYKEKGYMVLFHSSNIEQLIHITWYSTSNDLNVY